jgi:hypothetical protein
MEGVTLLEILIWVTLSAQIFLKLWSFFEVWTFYVTAMNGGKRFVFIYAFIVEL